MGDYQAWSQFCERNRPTGEADQGQASAGHPDATAQAHEHAKFNRAYRRSARTVTAIQSASIVLAFGDFVSDVVWAGNVREERIHGTCSRNSPIPYDVLHM